MLVALGLLLLTVTSTPLVSWWARQLAGPWHDPNGEVLVVLGGSTLETGIMGESSYWRSVYAISAFRQGGFRDIVLSGGGESGRTAAGSMKDFLICHGIPPQAIHLELHSRSTRENALFTKDVLASLPGRKVLLTSDYHMTRAVRAFRKVDVEILPRPLPDALKRSGSFSTRWGIFVDLTRETGALVYYLVRGWI
ncbi:MAG TPA: YdcF family protein [Vicinamibacterales bacterium]|nr:YdcF family protein [Vicinamibacterales bacterium]